jgi:hypothetical protein
MGLRAQQQKQKHEADGLMHNTCGSSNTAGLVVSELVNSRTSDVTVASAANSALASVAPGTEPAPVHPNDVVSNAIKPAPHFSL